MPEVVAQGQATPTRTVFYVPPPDGFANAATAFFAGFYATRSPWTRAVFEARLKALDPSAEYAAIQALSGDNADLARSLTTGQGQAIKARTDAGQQALDWNKAKLEYSGKVDAARITAQGGVTEEQIRARASNYQAQTLPGSAGATREMVHKDLRGLLAAAKAGKPAALGEAENQAARYLTTLRAMGVQPAALNAEAQAVLGLFEDAGVPAHAPTAEWAAAGLPTLETVSTKILQNSGASPDTTIPDYRGGVGSPAQPANWSWQPEEGAGSVSMSASSSERGPALVSSKTESTTHPVVGDEAGLGPVANALGQNTALQAELMQRIDSKRRALGGFGEPIVHSKPRAQQAWEGATSSPPYAGAIVKQRLQGYGKPDLESVMPPVPDVAVASPRPMPWYAEADPYAGIYETPGAAEALQSPEQRMAKPIEAIPGVDPALLDELAGLNAKSRRRARPEPAGPYAGGLGAAPGPLPGLGGR